MRRQATYPGHEMGEAKEEGKKGETTNTNTPSPERANPGKGKGKEKSGGRRAKHQREEGGRTEALDTTYKARAKPSPHAGPKPDLPPGSTHETRGQ